MKRKLQQVLRSAQESHCDHRGLTSAAVIVPLFERAGEWHILFTKRTEKVRDHKGQISFPGGVRAEEREPLLATALRESFEEIGLKEKDVEVLGKLEPVTTVSTNYTICPFVAVIPYPYAFALNPEEVEEVIEVPLSFLLDPANFREEWQVREGEMFLVYFYDYKGKVIWGATAKILKQLLELVSGEGYRHHR